MAHKMIQRKSLIFCIFNSKIQIAVLLVIQGAVKKKKLELKSITSLGLAFNSENIYFHIYSISLKF